MIWSLASGEEQLGSGLGLLDGTGLELLDGTGLGLLEPCMLSDDLTCVLLTPIGEFCAPVSGGL